MPAAIVLLVCGLMACVAGYRLLWWVLAAFGFILGGLAASSILGTGDTAYMVGVFLAGGLAGALIMVAASFIGVALVGAGLGRGGRDAGVDADRRRSAPLCRRAGRRGRGMAGHLAAALRHHRRHGLRRAPGRCSSACSP